MLYVGPGHYLSEVLRHYRYHILMDSVGTFFIFKKKKKKIMHLICIQWDVYIWLNVNEILIAIVHHNNPSHPCIAAESNVWQLKMDFRIMM